MIKRALIAAATLALMLPLSAQDEQQTQQDSQQSQQKKPQKQKDQQTKQPADDSDKPKPLFGGTISAKSSQHKKDTTSLGFNGLDPQGQVEKSMLASSPTSIDEQMVDVLTRTKVDPSDLTEFIRDGQLKETRKQGGGQ